MTHTSEPVRPEDVLLASGPSGARTIRTVGEIVTDMDAGVANYERAADMRRTASRQMRDALAVNPGNILDLARQAASAFTRGQAPTIAAYGSYCVVGHVAEDGERVITEEWAKRYDD